MEKRATFPDCFLRFSAILFYKVNGIARARGIPDVHAAIEQPARKTEADVNRGEATNRRSIAD